MKKLVALFSAVSCLLACLPVQASAKTMTLEEVELLHHAESCRPYNLHAGALIGTCGFESYRLLPMYDSFLVVTDSEGLPEGWVDSLPPNTIYDSVTEWEDYASSNAFLTGRLSLQQTYGEDSRFYVIRLATKPITDDFELPYVECRQFEELFDNIRDTLILKHSLQGSCYWDGTFSVILNQEYSKKLKNEELSTEEIESSHPEIFGETSALEQFKQEYSGWTENYATWLAETPIDSMTTVNEILDSQNAANLVGADTVTMLASQTAEEVYEQNKDVLRGCFANLEVYDTIDVYTALSPYNDLGDINGDNKVNSLDAQAILQYSASSAVGEDSDSAEIEERSRADLNADGFVNAEDASLVLQYSAEKGAGFSGTLKEFLNR